MYADGDKDGIWGLEDLFRRVLGFDIRTNLTWLQHASQYVTYFNYLLPNANIANNTKTSSSLNNNSYSYNESSHTSGQKHATVQKLKHVQDLLYY